MINSVKLFFKILKLIFIYKTDKATKDEKWVNGILSNIKVEIQDYLNIPFNKICSLYYFSSFDFNTFGLYNDSKIFIDYGNLRLRFNNKLLLTFKIIETLCHEMCHFKQDQIENKELIPFSAFKSYRDYRNDNDEKEARRIAKQFCFDNFDLIVDEMIKFKIIYK